MVRAACPRNVLHADFETVGAWLEDAVRHGCSFSFFTTAADFTGNVVHAEMYLPSEVRAIGFHCGAVRAMVIQVCLTLRLRLASA